MQNVSTLSFWQQFRYFGNWILNFRGRSYFGKDDENVGGHNFQQVSSWGTKTIRSCAVLQSALKSIFANSFYVYLSLDHSLEWFYSARISVENSTILSHLPLPYQNLSNIQMITWWHVAEISQKIGVVYKGWSVNENTNGAKGVQCVHFQRWCVTKWREMPYCCFMDDPLRDWAFISKHKAKIWPAEMSS